MPTEPTVEEQWYKMLTEGKPVPRRLYHLHGLLPPDPRCKLCGSPFTPNQANNASNKKYSN